MKDIKAIEFVFENCECVTIEAPYIGDVLIEGIETSIRRVAVNSICESTSCKRFEVVISKEANIEIESYGEKIRKLSRINDWDDVTSIFLKYEDGSEKKILVPWLGESANKNKAQSSFMDKYGNLYLAINEECQNVLDIYTNDMMEQINRDFDFYKIWIE